MDSNCQTVTLEEQLTARTAGLLEVEPLQFSINSYSEYINVTHGNNPSRWHHLLYLKLRYCEVGTGFSQNALLLQI